MEIDLSDDAMDKRPLGFGKYAKLTPRQVLDRDPSYILWMASNLQEQVCSADLVDEAREAMEPQDKPVTSHVQRRSWDTDEHADDDVVSRMERLNNRR